MKKLYLNIILFLLPILVLLVLIPVKKRLKYQHIKNDCFNHGIWIYDRLFHNPKPIDIAFLGSSHTINALNDQLIEETLSDYDIHITNLGYCRLGRNLSYSLLKDLLQEKKPAFLFIEVREDEDRYSHPIFPHISESKDVLSPQILFNRDILDDIFTHLSYKLEICQQEILQKTANPPIRTEAFGFAASYDTARIVLLKEFRRKRNTSKANLSKLVRDFYMSFPRAYLKKISELCTENNVQLCFLYLPSYGINLKQPKEYQTYKQYGEIFFAPRSILDQTSNWYDENHLNQSGAKELSLWVALQIEHRLLIRGSPE